MRKNKRILPKPPKILATLTLTNTEYQSLSTLLPEVTESLENGIFFKNLDPLQPVTIKKSSVLNTQNELAIIQSDEIFIQTANFSDILIKSSSQNGQDISIIAN